MGGPVIRTLARRKVDVVAAKAAALDVLHPVLEGHARRLGGRYLLYGSAARGELRHGSDIDLLLDFLSHEATTAAWNAAEQSCAGLDLECDIRPLAWCSARFLERPARRGAAGMSDARWAEVDDDVAAATGHLTRSVELFDAGGFAAEDLESH